MRSRVFFPVFSAALFAVFFIVCMFAPEALAATRTWDGGGDGSTWSSAQCANWSDDTCPTNADIAVIQNTTVNVTEAVTVGELQLGDDSGDGDTILNFQYNAVGGTGMTVDDGNGQNGDVTVNGDATITHSVEDGTSYSIDMVVDGDFTIDSTAEIDVNGKGCRSPGGDNGDGYGPNGSNVCSQGTSQGGGDGGSVNGNDGQGAGHGGLGGDGDFNNAGGGTYGSSANPVLYGASGGDGDAGAGGAGGGLVVLNVTGALTVNGAITANGDDGAADTYLTTDGAGGGAGGSINLTSGSLVVSGNNSITANGGDGADGDAGEGGGGGGGRVAINYATTQSGISTTTVTVTGGTGPDSATDGAKGTVYTEDTGSNDVTVYHGFTFDNTDYSETSWTMDSSATNQYCESGTTSPTITVSGTLTLGGTINCSEAVDFFNFTGATVNFDDSTDFTISGPVNISATSDIDDTWGTTDDGISIVLSDVGDDLTFNIPNSESITIEDSTITLQSEGIFYLCPDTDCDTGTNASNVVNVTLTESAGDTMAINASIDWQELGTLTVGSGATINANGKGCQSPGGDNGDGYGPNGSNVCSQGLTQGGGDGGSVNGNDGQGAGHGGAGGDGTHNNNGGVTYGSSTDPVLFGASGGDGDAGAGGAGGGLVLIDATGTVTVTGSITADGNDGGVDTNSTTDGAGGGAGGSININTPGTIAGSGSLSATGGDGVDGASGDGGGGGGGRIAVVYAIDTSSFLGSLAAATETAGGAGPTGGSSDGGDGSVSVVQLLAISTAVTSVNGGGTTVNRLTLTFNQAADITDGVAGDGLDSVSLSASTGTCTVSNADYADTNTTTLVLTVSCTGDAANNTAITIDVTYDDTGNDVIEPTGGGTEIANGSATTGTDGAAPAIVSGTFYDASSSDGKLDLVTIVFSENISAVADASADWAISSSANFSSLVEGTVECNSGSAAANECDYNFTTSTIKTDVGDLTLAYTAGTSLTDGTNNAGSLSLSSGSSPAFTDGAAPVISSFDYQDGDEDGLIDRFNVLFSETVIAASSVLGEADLTLTNVGDFTDLDWGPDATDRLTSDVSSLLMVPGIESSASDTRDDSGNLAISTQSNFTLQDSAGNTNSTLGAQDQASFTDGAAPVYLSGSYTDDDDDGQVDLLSVTFTETISTNAAALGDFTFTANDITSADLSGGTNPGDTGSATITLALGTDGAANVTSHSTAPTLAYTFSSGDLQDASNNQIVNFSAQNLSDAAAPVIVSRTTLDNNLDGTADYLKIVWSESIDDTTVAASDFVTFVNPACAPTCGGALSESFTSGTPSSGTETDTGNDATIYVGVSDNGQTITPLTTNIKVRVTVTGTVDDSAGNTSAAEGSPTQSDDGQAPIISSYSYSDEDGDGKIDRVTVSFSENVVGGSHFGEDDVTINNVGDFTSLALPAVVDDAITETQGSVAFDADTEASVIDTSDDSGNFQITTSGGFSLVDSVGNTNTTTGAVSTSLAADSAAPVIASFTYQDDDADGKVDQFLVTFSETLDGSSVLAADDLVFGDVGDFEGALFGSDDSDLAGAVSSLTVVLGTEATATTTVDDSGTLAVSTQGDFSLSDGTNTNTTTGNQSQASYVDGAAPAPTTVTFYDASSSDGKIDLITVVFSEDLSAAADASSDWAVSSSANFADLSEGTVECNSGSAGTNECDYNFTTSTVKTDVGDLTLTYTAGTSVSDGTNNTASLTFNSGSTPAFTDGAAPEAVDAQISISGASGTGGAYKIGDTITVSWDASNTSDVNSVTADLSGWGGSATATMTDTTTCGGTDSDNVYEACYTILGSEGIDTTGVNVSVDATDTATNNRSNADTTGATVDTIAPTVTAGNISVTGATGTSGAFKNGDTAVPTWDNTGSGDNNSDTLASVTINAANFASSDTALSASDASGTWTASLSGGLDSQDDTSNNITVTVVDNAGNSTSTAGTNNYVVDTIVPVITADNVTVTGCTGTGGACKNGDTLVLNWLGDTDGESDTIASVTFVATDFDTDSSSVSGSDPGTPGTNDWTGSLTGSLDSQDDTGNQITATVVDNAGNSTGPVTSTATYTVDTILPTLSSQVYQDSDTDGTVDRIVLTFSEDVSNGFSADKDEWTFPEVSEMNFVAPDDDSDVTNATTTVTVVIGSDAQETGHTTAPTVSYTSTAGTLQDDAGNAVANFSAQTLTDDAAPQTHATTTPNTIDNNDDGTVDFVQITFTESLSDASVAAADFKAYISTDDTGSLAESFTSTTPASGNYTDTANDAVIYIGVSSSSETISANTTDYRLYIQMIGSLEDATGNASSAEGSATQSNDLAQPRIVSSQTGDNDADGQIDRIVITFTEDLSDGSVDGSDFSIPGFTVSDASDASGTVTVTLVESGSPDTDATPPVSIFGNGLADASSGANLNDFLSSTPTDAAGPVWVSASPDNGETHIPAVNDFTITFSEPIDTGSFALSESPSLVAGSFSYAWDGTDETVTVSPGTYTMGTTITHTITAPDTTGNAYAGATYSLYPLMPSSSGGGGGGGGGGASTVSVTPDTVTLTAPNGSESLTGGETYDITWISSGNIDNVSLYYSVDGGATYASIVSGTDNDGSYAWRVPNTATTDGFVKIVGRDSGAATLATDTSDASYAIEVDPTIPLEGAPEVDESGTTSGSIDIVSDIPIVEVTLTDGTATMLLSGHLFRGETLTGVYLVDQDGRRRVFPSESVFFSYYQNFDDVLMVTDDQLRKLPVGRRVTMASGRMVKIQSNPNVYQVHDGGILRLVPDEATARALYGDAWNTLITDVAPTFWGDYTVGEALETS